jgi:hypothetical protein
MPAKQVKGACDMLARQAKGAKDAHDQVPRRWFGSASSDSAFDLEVDTGGGSHHYFQQQL